MSGGPGKFLEELNRSFGSGVLTSTLEPQEFRIFLKWLMKNYFRYISSSKSCIRTLISVDSKAENIDLKTPVFKP